MPPRLEAHRLIEEMMVCANRCAAEQLERKQTPLIYRVHDAPSLEKVKGFSNFIRPLGVKLNRGQTLLPQLFNQILQSAPAEAHADMISEAVLRTQSQAAYATENIGHFGLNLSHYAHFTSPIRRYADLIVHRGLISALGLGEDGLSETDRAQMVDTAESISQSERRAMMAERAANERYLSAFMSKRVGETFDGMITGLSRAGLFIRLHETGAEGLAPISRLGGERFVVDDDGYTMTGLASGLSFKLGEAVEVTLEETIPVKGGLLFSLEAGGQFSSRKKSTATKKQKKIRPKKAKPKR
jgi:ribonuclease R